MAESGPPAALDIRTAAEAAAIRYPEAPARETEAAIATLALLALDCLEVGGLAPEDVDRAFTLLDTRIGDAREGPELSDRAHDLVTEGGPLPPFRRRVGPRPPIRPRPGLRDPPKQSITVVKRGPSSANTGDGRPWRGGRNLVGSHVDGHAEKPWRADLLVAIIG